MSPVAKTLGVGRSTVYDRLTGRTRTRGPYAKADDADLLPRIRQIAAQQPTYGYRRYRIMAADRLMLARRYTERADYGHDGAVVAIRSNLRGCSDGFKFTCWNGEVVRGAFIIDAHNRELIAWRAVANAGISGSDVRDIMLEAVETRFGGMRAPVPVVMLSDNGSTYTARETRTFARQLGLKPCFTPVRSPQSNGISEVFVHTLKRDYVRVSSLPDAPNALTSLAGWIADYNDNHPHSGLKMRSPREHRALVSATA